MLENGSCSGFCFVLIQSLIFVTIPTFISKTRYYLVQLNANLVGIHLSVQTKKARELITWTEDPFRAKPYSTGRLEYLCFMTLLGIRIFQKEIIFLVLKSSGPPVILNEEWKYVFFSEFQKRNFLRLHVPGNVIGISWWKKDQDLT